MRPNADKHITRCTCGAWAFQWQPCPVCGRITAEPYRRTA